MSRKVFKRIATVVAFLSISLFFISNAESAFAIEVVEPGGEAKTCRQNEGGGIVVWKRLCHDCKTHFANWSGKSTCFQ